MRATREFAAVAIAGLTALLLQGMTASTALAAPIAVGSGWTATQIAHTFTPIAVAANGSGHLYVVNSADRQVVELDGTSGAQITTFNTAADNLHNLTGVATDGSGAVFVSEGVPGNVGTGLVVKLNASTGAVVAQFDSTSAALTDPTRLAANSSGVYVSDDVGVVELNASTGAVVPGFAMDTTSQAIAPKGLLLDGSGHLYVANGACSSGAPPVLEVSATTGAVVPSFDSSNQNLGLPSDLALDSSGHLLVTMGTCFVGPDGVDELDASTGVIVGHMTHGGGLADIATNALGDLFIAEPTLSQLGEFTIANSNQVTAFAPFPEHLSSPSSLTLDPANNLFLLDRSKSLIDEFNGLTGALETGFKNTSDPVIPDAVTAYGTSLFVTGLNKSNSLNTYTAEINEKGAAQQTAVVVAQPNPALLAPVDPTHLFAVTTTSAQIVEVNPQVTGAPYSSFSVAGDGLTHIDGIVADSSGHLYVSETCPTNRVVELDASTGSIIAGFDTSGLNLQCPSSVAVDGAGDVYVADSSGTIRELSPGAAAVISTINAAAAGILLTGSLALTSAGRVFVTASDGVWRIDPTSAVAPTAPTVTSITPGDTTASVNWTPNDAGSSPITGFTATASPGGHSCSAGAGARQCVITGLSPNTTYSVTVTATNATGPSSPSLPASTTTSHYALTVKISGAGWVTSNDGQINCPQDCSAVYASGPTIVLTAQNTVGSVFTGWSGACTGTGTCTVTMSQPRAVTATYKAAATDSVGIHVLGSGAGNLTINGIHCGGYCVDFGNPYPHGSVVTIVAKPSTGSYFAGWSGGTCSGVAATCSFTLNTTVTVTATFTTGTPPPPSYPLSIARAGTGTGTVAGSGLACPGSCTRTYPAGSVVTLTAKPASNATFAGWQGACTGTAKCVVTMNAARSATAMFTKIPAPATQLTLAHLDQKTRSVAFHFQAAGHVTSYQCALARNLAAVVFKACTSPKTYTHLTPASYLFEVRAVGLGGTDATPAKHRFTIT